jgi:hypothetical protein
METREVYLETFDVFSISYSADINAIFEFCPYTLQVLTRRRWVWTVILVFSLEALGGTLASEVGMSGLSRILIGRSSIK